MYPPSVVGAAAAAAPGGGGLSFASELCCMVAGLAGMRAWRLGCVLCCASLAGKRGWTRGWRDGGAGQQRAGLHTSLLALQFLVMGCSWLLVRAEVDVWDSAQVSVAELWSAIAGVEWYRESN